MARKPSTHPTDAELEILRVLWDAGPLPLGEICSAVRQERAAATTTIATILGVMLNKGYVRRREGPKGYLWSAALKRQATASKAIRKVVDFVFDGSAGQLVAHLIDNNELSDTDINKIRAMLEEYEGRADKRDKSS